MMTRRLGDPQLVGETAALMRLLGDATRIRVLGLLYRGEMNVSALCAELELAQPTVSHHLGLLRVAGVLVARRAGKQIYYSLNPDHVSTINGDSTLQFSLGRIHMSLGYNGRRSGGNGSARNGPRRVSPRTNRGTPALN